MSQNNYDNTNRGALFTAREKRNTNSPDYTGEVNVNGVNYFISGWGKVDRHGKKFVSLALTAKTPYNNATGSSTPPNTGDPAYDFNGGDKNLF